MGNKVPGSEQKRTVADVRDFFRRRKRADPLPSSSSSSYNYNRDKMNSCPDLIRAEKGPLSKSREGQEPAEEEKPIGLKIYRSYQDIADSKMSSYSEIPTLEIRVYRRSTEGLATAGKAVSLPRGMERSFGAASEISNGSDYRPASRECTSAIETRSSRRGSSRSSMTSIGCRVTAEEFPDTLAVKKKLKDFETNFVTGLVEAFRCLPPLNQLAAISVATRPDRVNQSVSLLQYLESDSIPADLQTVTDAGQNREYILTIPERSFEIIRKIKVQRLTDQRLTAAVDILQDHAREAAFELGRIFEYQLSLIIEPVAMRLVARHAVDCIVHVLKRRNRILDKNTVVQGVLRGRPRISEHLPRFISIIVGSRELKWNIYEIFKRPALRKELCNPGAVRAMSSASSRLSDELDFMSMRPSWKFYTAAQCEPMTYGYRGQLVEWDFVNGHFRLSSEEESAFAEEVSWRYDDFHRIYCPYHRLIGQDMIESYYKTGVMSSSETAFFSLADFVRQSRSGAYVRDEIKLVFRPLGPVSSGLDLRQLGLDEMDIARVKTTHSKQERTSLMDTAIEVTRRCEELRCKLEEMEIMSPTSPELDCHVESMRDGTPERRRLCVGQEDISSRKDRIGIAPTGDAGAPRSPAPRSPAPRSPASAKHNAETVTDV